METAAVRIAVSMSPSVLAVGLPTTSVLGVLISAFEASRSNEPLPAI